MSDSPNFDDLEDEIPENPPRLAPTKRESAATAIANLAFEAALTRRARAGLKCRPGLFIVKVPDADWAEIIDQAVRCGDDAPHVTIAVERKKSGGIHHRVGREELRVLRRGRSLMYITQDPTELLDEAVLAAADLTITIPPLTPALLRSVIRRVTGGIARGVTADMTGLQLPVILSIVRPGLTAGECVKKLRRAVAGEPTLPVSSVPLLSELPLTDIVRDWTARTLADLDAVKTGSLPPDQLPFAMLEGVPGGGKTLIAESLARTAGWTFVPSSVGTWFTSGDGALGGVARNLKAFIDQILLSEPAVGFMDELDALPNRATMDNRGRAWWTPVINLFLTEIDRLRKSGKRVILIGATNYYDRLDSALIRPGRLQERVSVLPPRSEGEVIALMRYCLRGDLADADLGAPAKLGRGATPAMVEGWIKQARGLARANNRPLELQDVVEQMLPKEERSPGDVRAVALHEIGHAVVACRLGHVVEAVSVVSDGPAGGHTVTRLATTVPTWEQLTDMVAVTLGGRAADLVVGNGANTGAEADLARATKLLLDAHESQGLRGDLVYRPVLGSSGHEHTAGSIAAELNRQLNRASAIIAANRQVVLALAERLVAEKVLAGNEVAAVVGAAPQRPAAGDTPALAAGAAHNPGSGGAQSETAPRQAVDGAEGDLATAIHPLINAMSRHDPSSSRDGAGRCALPPAE